MLVTFANVAHLRCCVSLRIKQEAEEAESPSTINVAHQAAILAGKNRPPPSETTSTSGAVYEADPVLSPTSVETQQPMRWLRNRDEKHRRRQVRKSRTDETPSIPLSEEVRVIGRLRGPKSPDVTVVQSDVQEVHSNTPSPVDACGDSQSAVPLELRIDNLVSPSRAPEETTPLDRRNKEGCVNAIFAASGLVCERGIARIADYDERRLTLDGDEDQRQDGIESGSEYGEESFESPDCAKGTAMASFAEAKSTDCVGREGVGFVADGTDNGDHRGDENSAAQKITACWRRFLSTCEAKGILRSVLLDALRRLGGGRMSKVRLTCCRRLANDYAPAVFSRNRQ